jgi:hypothetical protein
MLLSTIFLVCSLLDKEAEPVFRMTFVQDAVQQGQSFEIFDAKPDLSALGFSSISMTDNVVCYRIWIERGRHFKGSEGFWPFAFADANSVQGFVGDYCPFFGEEANRRDIFLGSSYAKKGKRLGKVEERQSPHASQPIAPFSGIKIFDPAWWPTSIRQEDRVLSPNTVYARSVETDIGRFVNLVYHPSTPGYLVCMPGGERRAALFETRSGFERLESHVRGAGGVEMEQIVWADKSGWMIASATKGETSGLAWLYPVRSAQKGQSSASSSPTSP